MSQETVTIATQTKLVVALCLTGWAIITQQADLTKQTVNEGLRQLIAPGWVKKVVRGLYEFNEDPRQDDDNLVG